MRDWLAAGEQPILRPLPCPHPSRTPSYESLDHFLFQSDIHWNGYTVFDGSESEVR